jgi:TonB family protein
MKNTWIILVFAALIFPSLGFTQAEGSTTLSYEVNKVYPYLSVMREELKEATTLVDLNHRYKPSWVKEYTSVEVAAICQGQIRKAVGKNDLLTPAQKNILNTADAGTEITVKVLYLPQNTLAHNEMKELAFTFTVNPENDAHFAGGQAQLMQYLKENAIDEIPVGSFKGYDLAAVKFTISEEGEITDVHIFESSKDKRIDALLLTTISRMPCWEPAIDADGTKVKQTFALTVGNMENCMVNLLNIRRNR